MPPEWVNRPLVRVPVVGLLGLLHVPGAQMSRNDGVRRNQIYIPPPEKFSRASALIAMVGGVVMFGALIVSMMVLAQVLYWVLP